MIKTLFIIFVHKFLFINMFYKCNITIRHWGTGGLWDAEDDCCEPPCTPDHPCAEEEGHCEVDADCQV